MKKSKRVLSAILALIMLVGMLPIVSFTVSAAEPDVGMTFEDNDYNYAMKDKISAPGSFTIEAEVWIPYNTKDNNRTGVIIGNYCDEPNVENGRSFGLELYNNGAVRLYSRHFNDNKFSYDIRKDMGTSSSPTFAKITVVGDTVNKKLYLYVNGELKETKSCNKLVDGVMTNLSDTLCVGGDRRVGNAQNFKGKIKNVTMYSDIRTPDEIAASAAGTYSVDSNDTALLVAYDLTSSTPYTDLSKNANNLKFVSKYGEDFSATDPIIRLDNDLTSVPKTYEAMIYAPTDVSRTGVIVGNYQSQNGEQMCLNFEIHNNGAPSLYIKNKSGVVSAPKFQSKASDVRREGWVHLVIVDDGSNYLCYIDGVHTETVKHEFSYDIADVQSVNKLSIGRDTRDARTFAGKIRHIAYYSEPLTAAQVKAVYENGVDTSNESLMFYYDLNAGGTKNVIKDQSGNNNHASTGYYEREEEKKDYAYSFAVVGDTQKQVWNDFNNGTTYTSNLYKWIVDNKEEKNIQWVFGVGDITENNGIRNGATMDEWNIAKNAITQLDDAGINYSVILGNHDIITVDGDGGSKYFNQYFGSAAGDFYTKRVTGYYEEGKLDNYYMNFEVAGIKYMMIGLEYGANDKILKWAGDVADANPERIVIVTTHAYMFRDGTTLDKGDVVPPNSTGVTTSDTSRNNGDMMWEKFASQHRNVLMVLSGHDPYSNIAFRQDRGVHGNVVSQFLVDPQSMDVTLGMVCMLYFSEDGKQVSVEWISTGKTQEAQALDPEAGDVLYKAINQFDFTMIDNVNNTIHSIGLAENESDETKSVYRIYYTNGTYSEFVVYNGKNGETGAAGAPGVTPKLRINADNEWEVSYDNGATYTSLGVKATGEKGDKGDPGAAGNSVTVTGVELTAQNDLVDTYTITFSDGTTAEFNVTNGKDGENGKDVTEGATVTVTGVELTAKNGLKDTYTISFSDGTTTEFTVTNGADGEDGKTPYVGANGNWFLGDTDTGVLARGIDGAIPYVGVNGNWWVGGVDTEVPAQGEKGEPGTPGANGATGATGATGAQGPQGEKGEKGDKGAMGDTGATGPQGASGTNTTVVVVGIAAGICGVGSVGMAISCVLFVTKKRAA